MRRRESDWLEGGCEGGVRERCEGRVGEKEGE